jgi:acetyl-CoA carboxylase biotin carboxyl carrier protein
MDDPAVATRLDRHEFRRRRRGRGVHGGGYRARPLSDPSLLQEASVADVEAHITGTVWKIECVVGDQIDEGDTVVILESMKMEMPVEAEDAGTVKEILCEEGQAVNEGDTLVVLE